MRYSIVDVHDTGCCVSVSPFVCHVYIHRPQAKRCKIRLRLLLITNRKSLIGFYIYMQVIDLG